MPADPILTSIKGTDLSTRFKVSTTVVASPTGATETIIASLQIGYLERITTGVLLGCTAAFTVGTSGVSANLKIRQTDTSGTTIAATGAVTETAANLDQLTVIGFDTAAAAGQIYKATLTVASGAATSTVSGLTFFCIVI